MNVKPAPKLTKENTKIDWTQSADHIHNQIRGLNPFPLAWANLKWKDKILNVKFFKSKIIHKTHSVSCWPNRNRWKKIISLFIQEME
jgi:methionyl-tRNA formyltransferase